MKHIGTEQCRYLLFIAHNEICRNLVVCWAISKHFSVGGGNNHWLYGLRFQDLLHFSSKGQFDEARQATLNGLEQQEQTPVPSETQSTLEQQSENHPLQIQPQHDESVVPTQSTMTADDMRRAKRIRVSKDNVGSYFLSPSPFAVTQRMLDLSERSSWSLSPTAVSVSKSWIKHLIPSKFSFWEEDKSHVKNAYLVRCYWELVTNWSWFNSSTVILSQKHSPSKLASRSASNSRLDHGAVAQTGLFTAPSVPPGTFALQIVAEEKPQPQFRSA